MNWNRKILAAFCLAFVGAFSCIDVGAQEAPSNESPVTARLISDVSAIVPGEPIWVGVLLKMAPGWHTYYREPGDSGMATGIHWRLPEGFSAGDLQWPAPQREIEPGDFKVNIYKDEVLLFARVTVPAQAGGAQVRLEAKVDWLACKQSCIPGNAEVSLTLPLIPKGQTPPRPPASADAPLFDKYRTQLPATGQGPTSPPSTETKRPANPAAPASESATPGSPAPTGGAFWHYLFFAFLGGLVLNVMPCVLPVISLKILGFLQHGHESRGRMRLLGFTYAFGVICSFLALAALVIATQNAGRLAGWGMQFQSPIFVVAITTLVTLVSLNLFGLFEVTLGSSTLSAASGLASREGLAGAFFNGIFAVILATPCTAPFLGAALGFAFLQPPAVVALFFLTVAIGLALPYVLLCSFPALGRFLPKPGAWMERFKIAMGFPMLATAVWLYSVATRHYGSESIWLGLFLVCLGFAAWIYGEFVQRGRTRRTLAGAIALLLLLGGYGFALENRLHWRNPAPVAGAGERLRESAGGIDWKTWSPGAIEAARKQGHPVLVDFTADWCLTCQTNKVTSLEIPSVRAALKQGGFQAFIGDYTRSDEAIGRELKKFNRAGVPLVLVYPAQGDPIVLPELLTPGVVLDALRRAVGE